MPKKQKRKKRLICSVHDDILLYCDELDDYLTNKNAQKIVDKIRKATEEARGYGKSMEDRLHRYKSDIEGLGFKRQKKK